MLRGLIETALANNRDLRKTLLNVEAARAMYRVQRADRLPTIGAQASGTRQHNPADLNPSGRAGVQSEWRAGLGVTAFELDLPGACAACRKPRWKSIWPPRAARAAPASA